MRLTNQYTFTGILTLLLLTTILPAHADIIYQFTVDTSTISGNTGYVDLQFNPGGIDAIDAEVGISEVTTDGNLASSAIDTGGATGELPLSAVLQNGANYNDIFQGMSFGNSLQFVATFSGQALTPSSPIPFSGSTFALSLYASDQISPLLTNSASGAIATVDINPNGSTTPATFVDSNGATHVTVSFVPTNSVPEPGFLSLVACLATSGSILVIARAFSRDRRY